MACAVEPPLRDVAGCNGSRDRCTAMDDDYHGFKSRPSLRLPASVLFSVV